MRTLSLIALLLVVAGCAASPPTHYFTLATVPGSAPAASGSAAGAPLAVDAVHLPGTLDRLEMVRRADQNRLAISETDRWGEPLDEMTRDVLDQDLMMRLPAGAVLPPGAPKAGRTRAIVVNVQEFDSDAAGRVRLYAEWSLLEGGAQQPRLRREERIELDGAKDAAGQAAVMSKALGELADRIAAAVEGAPARS